MVAHLRRAIGRVSEDLSEVPGKHIGEDRRAFDQSGIAKASLLAGAVVPVDEDHVSPALLQMQSGADADHTRPQDEDVGLEFRHPALPRWLGACSRAWSEASYCRVAVQTSLRGGQTLATMELT